MKQGKRGVKNAENELLAELEMLREQARKAALLEAENQALKAQLHDQQEVLKDTQKNGRTVNGKSKSLDTGCLKLITRSSNGKSGSLVASRNALFHLMPISWF